MKDKFMKNGVFSLEYDKETLKDNLVYQILYRIEKHVTSAGNKSKRKIYFIKKDDEKLIFDDEVKKCLVHLKDHIL